MSFSQAFKKFKRTKFKFPFNFVYGNLGDSGQLVVVFRVNESPFTMFGDAIILTGDDSELFI